MEQVRHRCPACGAMSLVLVEVHDEKQSVVIAEYCEAEGCGYENEDATDFKSV